MCVCVCMCSGRMLGYLEKAVHFRSSLFAFFICYCSSLVLLIFTNNMIFACPSLQLTYIKHLLFSLSLSLSVCVQVHGLWGV